MTRKLLNLARANAGKGAAIRAEATAEDTATIYVYDVIDSYWGASASDLAKVLSGITAPNIVLRINSPGGDVFEGTAMRSLLMEHPANITAKIDGVAASAASVLALAASSVEIADGGFYMIHKGWTFMMGNADDLRTTAGLLDKVDGTIIAAYAAKTGMDAAAIETLMAAETWYTGDEAVAAGFADKIMPTTTAAAKSAKASAFNLSVYDNAPQALTEPSSEDDDAARQRYLARLGLYERTAN